ncbi:uncharacterized protein LOC108095791 isoform X2 [Drosophila ficusphila]|uniref:uncharacterized protein LOC108095791 isoform X2 n=1 Tax=Drosophila ficusphila TaxID=30025 RepID=UPI0007E7EA77|nr:uncharacterized protein LOC108095791 isoform X2 [Drosophila ficusphila]
MRLVRSKCCQRDVSDYLSTPHQSSTNSEVHTKNIFTRYWDDHIKMKELNEERSRGKPTSSSSSAPAKQIQSVTFVRSTGTSNPPAVCDLNGNGNGNSAQTEWTFPPKAPTPHIYNCLTPDMMASSDKNSFKGFRKQFSGRFKRLVTRKVEHTPVIPPELKPQLKTIYVY